MIDGIAEVGVESKGVCSVAEVDGTENCRVTGGDVGKGGRSSMSSLYSSHESLLMDRSSMELL